MTYNALDLLRYLLAALCFTGATAYLFTSLWKDFSYMILPLAFLRLLSTQQRAELLCGLAKFWILFPELERITVTGRKDSDGRYNVQLVEVDFIKSVHALSNQERAAVMDRMVTRIAQQDALHYASARLGLISAMWGKLLSPTLNRVPYLCDGTYRRMRDPVATLQKYPPC